MRKVCLEAFDNQDVPFDLLVDALQPARDLIDTTISNYVCSQESGRGKSFGIKFKKQSTSEESSNFDLNLITTEGEGCYELKLQYNTDLYSRETAKELCERLERLFGILASNPELEIKEIEPCTETQLTKMLEWSCGKKLEIKAKYAQDWVRRNAIENPKGIASETSNMKLSYKVR